MNEEVTVSEEDAVNEEHVVEWVADEGDRNTTIGDHESIRDLRLRGVVIHLLVTTEDPDEKSTPTCLLAVEETA